MCFRASVPYSLLHTVGTSVQQESKKVSPEVFLTQSVRNGVIMLQITDAFHYLLSKEVDDSVLNAEVGRKAACF